MIDYYEFLRGKEERHVPSGFNISTDALHSRLFDWQKEIVKRHCRLGRSAIFADTGLGKTGMSLEWARHVAQHGRVLIICPLAVAWQFTEEAQHFGLNVPYVRTQAEAEVACNSICVTNYDMVKHFKPERWAGSVLDEASSLKNHTGAFRRLMMRMWHDTPYKLAQTATPSPNNPTEILEVAEWLGIMETGLALTRWFRRDSQKANHLTLRGHAAREYYQWLSSWTTALTRPSDLGNYSDDGYILPPLNIVPLLVNIDYKRFHQQGQLLPNGRRSATEMHTDKRETINERMTRAADIATSTGDPVVVWVTTDTESKEAMRLLQGHNVVEVKGSQKTEEKERRLRGFADGSYRIIVTKPSIASLGLNWQHCHTMVFASIDFSFEKRYQAIRRCYRFRQQRQVNVYVISTESETGIAQAIAAKEQQHRELIGNIIAAQQRTGLHQDSTRLTLDDYQPTVPMALPSWLLERRAA